MRRSIQRASDSGLTLRHMKNSYRPTASRRRQLFLTLFQIVGMGVTGALLCSAEQLKSTPRGAWHPPKSCILTRNPVRATRVSVDAGRSIFLMRCAGCHGSKGHGDGPDASQLHTRPAILSSAAVQDQTDGALWWKISFGKRPMPAFVLRLSMTDRWNVINYLRTLRSE